MIETDAQTIEKLTMARWMVVNRIAFEMDHDVSSRSITISLIDKKHECVLFSKTFSDLIAIDQGKLQELVHEFEETEVFPCLFNWYDIFEPPKHRLIRKD